MKNLKHLTIDKYSSFDLLIFDLDLFEENYFSK